MVELVAVLVALEPIIVKEDLIANAYGEWVHVAVAAPKPFGTRPSFESVERALEAMCSDCGWQPPTPLLPATLAKDGSSDPSEGSDAPSSCRSPMGEPMAVRFAWETTPSDEDERPTHLYEEQINLRSPGRSLRAVRWVVSRGDGEPEELIHELRFPDGAWTRRVYVRQA